MNRVRNTLSIAALCLVVACKPAPEPRSASREPVLRAPESSRDFGNYVVHFNAIQTNQLTPEIAREYGIVRSANRAMLNISIVEKESGTVGHPVSGSVVASAVNLAGQNRELVVREILEESAVYYIAEFPVANEETLIFTIDATPTSGRSRLSVRYMKQFYRN